MTDKRCLKRTVAFWQFVDAASMAPVGQVDWPTFMAEVAENARNGRSRHVIDAADVTGAAYSRNDVDHLVLTETRDDMPRQQNRDTGTVTDMVTTGEGWEVVESTFVHFLPFGNVFGLLRSQITAPSPQAVARWINATKILNMQLAVEPVIDPERWRYLNDAGGVSYLEFAGPSVVLAKRVSGPLDHYLHPARYATGKIGIKINVGRTRNPQDDQQRRDLYLATEELARSIGLENLSTAKVRTFDQDNKGVQAETINLIKHRFTIKRDIQLKSGVNASVSELSAFDAIMAAVEKFEDDLRAAVRRDPME
ncbi:hypothetical protein [Pseudonocardia charpentierae]|uniref:Uncharacterized protein n=1 Tax=Pseudonocardia charpentierae TaxID=3075545 RepID=A0ABU2N2H9_9PSEU|nr:hypothetical protein [Pseudonocardia sp. DSM 45834]MDT0348126.1 hypothetical protein [Pseudonocardia sp. DSM 45834]